MTQLFTQKAQPFLPCHGFISLRCGKPLSLRYEAQASEAASIIRNFFIQHKIRISRRFDFFFFLTCIYIYKVYIIDAVDFDSGYLKTVRILRQIRPKPTK